MKVKKKGFMEFIVIPYGGGWEDYRICINGSETTLYTSTTRGKYLSEFLRTLCYFHKDYGSYDYVDGLLDLEEFDWGEYGVEKIPLSATFTWDGETKAMHWKMIRGDAITEDDFLLDIQITRDFWLAEEKDDFSFTVSYRELCYAVAKGVTDTLKKHGFMGWSKSAYELTLELRYLVFLKAYVLGKLSKIVSDYKQPKGVGPRSSFRNEWRILLKELK